MSFRAINKKEYEDAINNGLSEREAINKSKWLSLSAFKLKNDLFSDIIILPGYKEFYGFDKPNRKVLINEKWTYVNNYQRKDGVNVRPFFTPSNKNGLYKKENIDYTKEQIHQIAQDLLLAEFVEGNLKINYCGIHIPLNCFDIIKYDDPERYLEVKKNLIGLTHKENRRADLLIEFNSWNEKFGYGIVFEIANTENAISLEEKKHDWNLNHYSYVKLKVEDFNIHNETIPSERKIIVDAAMDKFKEEQTEKIENIIKTNDIIKINNSNELNILKQSKKDLLDELKDEINDELTHLKSKTIELQLKISAKLDSQEDLANKLKETKDKLIQEAIDVLSFDINQKVKEIIDVIERKVKEGINQDIIQKIQDISADFPDLMNKLDKKVFNLCENNRISCFNIIKHKADEYFEQKRKEVER